MCRDIHKIKAAHLWTFYQPFQQEGSEWLQGKAPANSPLVQGDSK